MKKTACFRRHILIRFILTVSLLISVLCRFSIAQTPRVTPSEPVLYEQECTHIHAPAQPATNRDPAGQVTSPTVYTEFGREYSPLHAPYESDSQTTTGTTCPNSNFSMGTFANWKGYYGTFGNPAANQGFISIPPNERHKIIPAPGYDDPYGFTNDGTSTLTTVFPGEAFSARLGNEINGAQAEQLTYDITIGPENDFFIYRYAVVLNDAGHQPNQQPSFEIDITDQATGQQFDPLCGYYYVFAQPGLPGWRTSPLTAYNAPVHWKNWTTVGLAFDVSDYGKSLTIVFTTKDCSPTGHFGYAYLSAFCSSLSVAFQGCEGSNQVVMTGPPGFADYEWTGPYCATCSPTIVGTGPSITIINANTGDEYRLKLVSFYNYPNCVIQKVQSTVAFTHIHPGFTASINCIANPSIFYDTSDINQNATDLRIWDFGDGTGTVTNTTASISHVFATAGVYTVTLTRSSTDPCSATCSGTVTVTNLPPTITNPVMDKTICSGSSVNIPLTFSQAPATGTWTKTVTAGTVTITTNPPGQTGSLINDVIINTGTVTATVVYTIIPHIGDCFGPPGTHTVTINPLPTATIGGTNTVCTNAAPPAILFTGALTSAPYTFSYNINGGSVQTVTTTTGNSVTVAAPTSLAGIFTYNLVGVQDGGATTCSQLQTGTATITVNPLPTAIISGATSVCKDSPSPVITFTGGASVAPYTFSYNINGGPPQVVTTAVGNSVTVTVPTGIEGNFTYNLVSVQDASSTTCSQPQTGSVTVQVNPLPTAIIAGTATVCRDAASPLITFTGGSATPPYTFTYNINGGPDLTVTTTSGNSATVAAPVSVAGTFTYNLVSVQDASLSLCSQVQTGIAIISVTPLPTATITGSVAVCKDDAAPLITFTGGSATPPYTFTYNVNGGPPQNISTTVGNSVTLSAPTNVAGAFNYNLVSVTDGSAMACSQPQPGNVLITINDLPTATIIGSTTVCRDATPPLVTFTGGTSTPPFTFTYNINGGPNQFVTTTAGNSVSVPVPTGTAGVFTYNLVSVQDGSSTACSQAQTGVAVITVNPLPTAAIAGTTGVCLNSPSPLITFTGGSSTPPYTFTYNINGGADQTVSTLSGNSVTVAAPTNITGTFTYNLISVKDASSTTCTQLQPGSAVVTIHPLPVPTITGPGANCLNTTNNYTTETGSGISGYQWNLLSGGTITNQTTYQPTVNWTSIGTHVITVNYIDVNGCTAAAPTTKQVTINTLPTPTISGDAAVCTGVTRTYTTETGAVSYAWSYPASGITLLAGGGVSDDFITIKWDSPANYTLSLNYVIGTGCTALAPTMYNVAVNSPPAPVISGPNPICGLSQQVYTVSPIVPLHQYLWTVTGGTIQSGMNANQATVLWGNSATAEINLTETIVYPGVSCSSQAPLFPVTLNPWPVAAGSISGLNSVCKNWTNIIYDVPPILNTESYVWNYSGSGVTFINNGSSVTATFTAAATNGAFTVKGVNSCGNGPVSPPLDVTVHSPLTISFVPCFDLKTTPGAKKIILRGGLPSLSGNGIYSGTRISLNAVTGQYEFDPFGAMAGAYQVNYSYTNTYNCEAIATPVSITVVNNSFSCGGLLTDVRDGRQYKTASISGRCWMAENLNYGTILVSPGSPQMDNCIAEKYCGPLDANCSQYGGLYQWDEAMEYAVAPLSKGICPPEWHLPSEAEWQSLIDNLLTGLGAPHANAIAGSTLKDLLPLNGFNALLGGLNYANNQWAFTAGSLTGSQYWTSTPLGTHKAVSRGLNVYNPSISRYQESRGNAFSVRCIKD